MSRRANPWVLFYHRFISARLVGQRRWSLVGLVSLLASLGAQAQSSTTVCTMNSIDLSSVVSTPAGGTLSFSKKPPAIAITAGRSHSLALLSNGRTRGWGRSDHGELSIFSVDPIIAIAAGDGFSVALKTDRTVEAWGENIYRQLNVPPSANAIASNSHHSLAIKADGTVVQWGDFVTDAVPTSATSVIGIAAGGAHNLALKTDGTVLAWGFNNGGQINVPASARPATAIAAGYSHSLALKADGSVVAWGIGQGGVTTVPASAIPAIAITAGYYHSLSLKADGTVVAWGDNTFGQRNVPASASLATAIAAGESHSLALKANGSVVGWGDNSYGQANGYDAEPLVSSVVSPTGTQTYYYTARPPGGRPTYGSVTVVVNPTPPARLYVNANATGAGNGQNWTDAFTDLQQALNYVCAQNLTEIWVAQGTYKPTTGTDRNSSFAMKNGVTLYGGFAGTETALNQRNPTSFTTVLSGDLGSSYDVSDNSYHVINNPAGLTNSAVLDGFVITGSNANGNGIFSALNGGGMLNNGGGAGNVCSPLIRNCIFQNNDANYGGALYNDGSSGGTSSPSLINCLFLSNFSGLGGALYNNGNGGISSPRLINCSFLNNTALNLGQTMSSQGSSNPVLVNCVVWGNGVSGARTFHNVSGAFITTRYSLLEASATGYNAGTGTLTTSTSPFVSPTDARLNNCSPAINTGDNTAYSLANGPATDLAGNARIFPSGGVIDMGAYEFQAAPTVITLTAPGQSTATVGVAFSQSFTASGGTSPYNYSLASGSLPTGLSLASTGVLSGTPTQAGSFTLTAKATDANGCFGVSAPYALTISRVPTDLVPVIYVRPSTVYGTKPITFVADVVEINSVSTSGLITLRIAKDPVVSLSFDGSATSVGGRPVSNASWSFSQTDSYYQLSTSRVVGAGEVLSVGLSGTLTPGPTAGSVTFSTVILSNSGGETRTDNNTAAAKISYFLKF